MKNKIEKQLLSTNEQAEKEQNQKSEKNKIGLGALPICLVLGIALGAAFNQVDVGIALGLCSGVIIANIF